TTVCAPVAGRAPDGIRDSGFGVRGALITWPITNPESLIPNPDRDDSFARAGCGELLDGTLHAIVLSAALLRAHPVVVSGRRLEVVYAHAERRVWMTMVQPDRIFGRLIEILAIGAVMHDAVMHVRTARIVGRPSDDRPVIGGRLELGALGDLHAV